MSSNEIAQGSYRLYKYNKKVVLTHIETQKFIIFDKETCKFNQVSSIEEDQTDTIIKLDVSIYIKVSYLNLIGSL